MKYVIPDNYRAMNYTNGKTRKYNYKRMADAFDNEMTQIEKKGLLALNWSEGHIMILCNNSKNLANISMFLDDMLIQDLRLGLEKFIAEESILASEVDLTDHYIQNLEQVDLLEAEGENPDEYSKRMGIFGLEIDTEKNTGKSYYVKGCQLGAFYRMWFGKEAYEFLDKEALRSFPCYENVVLNNDVTRITLYENILDYKKKENREKQWEFRRALHIDEIAHRMLEEEKEEQRRNADPELKFCKDILNMEAYEYFRPF